MGKYLEINELTRVEVRLDDNYSSLMSWCLSSWSNSIALFTKLYLR